MVWKAMHGVAGQGNAGLASRGVVGQVDARQARRDMDRNGEARLVEAKQARRDI